MAKYTKAILVMPWGRVGSNLVMAYLRKSRPSGRFANESFNQIKGIQDQLGWLGEFYNSPISNNFACCKQNILAMSSIESIESFLFETQVKVVRLFRSNLAKTVISQMRAEQYAKKKEKEIGRPVWAVNKDAEPLGPSIIDVDVFIRRLLLVEKLHLDLSKSFRYCDKIDIFYEDIQAHMQDAFSKISYFLEVPEIDFEPPYRKATPDDVASVVKNRKELQAALVQRGYDPTDLMG